MLVLLRKKIEKKIRIAVDQMEESI